MVVKYKIHELAKDFNIKSNVILDFFKSRGDEAKKSQTVLTTDELDMVFDYLTQKNSVESFDAYFAMKKPEPPKPSNEEVLLTEIRDLLKEQK